MQSNYLSGEICPALLEQLAAPPEALAGFGKKDLGGREERSRWRMGKDEREMGGEHSEYFSKTFDTPLSKSRATMKWENYPV